MPAKKQKPNVAVRLSEDLEHYLRAVAAKAHRTIAGEIRMRLEMSRELDRQSDQIGGRQ